MRPDGGRQPFCVEPCSWPTTTGVTAWSDWPQWTDFPEEHQPLLVDPGRAWQTMYKRFAAIRSGCFAREFQAFLQSPEGSADARPETLFATATSPSMQCSRPRSGLCSSRPKSNRSRPAPAAHPGLDAPLRPPSRPPPPRQTGRGGCPCQFMFRKLFAPLVRRECK